MGDVYFPSCNFTAASRQAAEKLRACLSKRMPVAGCCRTDQRDYTGQTAVYFCQACRETLEKKYGERIECENLFAYLSGLPDYPWPDYSGLTVTVQDCWRDREHPEIFDSVRACLQKMGVKVVEMGENRERSRYCGDLHFEPRKPENRALLARFPGTSLRELPQEDFGALMLEQTEKYPCSLVVCDCNACIRGLKAAQKSGWPGSAVHLAELVTGVFNP